MRISRYLQLFCFRAFLVFTLLFIISFSFPYSIFQDLGGYTHHLFERAATWSGDHVFHLHRPYASELVSDSAGFYLNAFNILVFSLLLAFAWGILFRNIRPDNRILYTFTAFVRYYLSLQLFLYGFSKIFKVQFYLPEPNILYTTLGRLPKDILYWSTMGVSRSYSVFLGITEILAASLLLFRRTTVAGALFSAFVLTNVTVINFAYDIDVKLLSCFYLSLALFLLVVNRKRLFVLMGRDPKASLSSWRPVWTNIRQKWSYRVTKLLVVSLILLEGLSPYIRAGNFNDDKMPRPYLHGAYNVETFILNHDTLAPLLTDTIRWKRVFFHRQGYFIIEKMNDDMWDDKMKYDTTRKEIYIMPYGAKEPVVFSYEVSVPGKMVLEGRVRQNKLKIILSRIDLQQLPVLRKGFHWTVDEIVNGE